MTVDLFESTARQPSSRGAAANCSVCGSNPATHQCDTCEQKICAICMITSNVLPLSHFCSTECRDEAESAAEQARHTDAYVRR